MGNYAPDIRILFLPWPRRPINITTPTGTINSFSNEMVYANLLFELFQIESPDQSPSLT